MWFSLVLIIVSTSVISSSLSERGEICLIKQFIYVLYNLGKQAQYFYFANMMTKQHAHACSENFFKAKCSSVVVFLNLSKIYNDFHVNNVTILCCYFGLQNFYSIIHFCLKIYYSHDGQRVWGGGVVKYRYTIHYFAMLLNFLSNIPYTLLPYKEVSMAYYMLNNLSILENQPQGAVLHSWQRLFSSLCF